MVWILLLLDVGVQTGSLSDNYLEVLDAFDYLQ